MAYHEEDPWRERRRNRRARPATALGCVLALGFMIVLAVIEFRAAMIIVGLVVVTAVVLLVGKRSDRRSK
ncbi:hypothetical protein AB0I27_11555 [Streptomyces sp. NPDC050597]|uniref:hypothetical protein n=1 Tax=Streptomyces sp. NPDC050597 TaxID=3157212 RepID=UPI00342CC998